MLIYKYIYIYICVCARVQAHWSIPQHGGTDFMMHLNWTKNKSCSEFDPFSNEFKITKLFHRCTLTKFKITNKSLRVKIIISDLMTRWNNGVQEWKMINKISPNHRNKENENLHISPNLHSNYKYVLATVRSHQKLNKKIINY